MVNNEDTRSFGDKSIRCRNFEMCEYKKLPNYETPLELKEVLKNYRTRFAFTGLCKSYADIIESLPKIKRIESKDYLVLFKILLFLEDYSIQLLAAKHNLVGVNITRAADTFVVIVPTLDKDDSIIKVGNEVRLNYAAKNNSGKKPEIYCKITMIEKQKVYLFPRKKPFLTKFDSNDKVDVNFLATNWSLKCCHYVLHIMFKHNLVDLIYPKIDTSLHTLPKSDLDWTHKSVAENPEQKTAVYNILNNAAYPAPYIIFGPPGTGKTTTLIETICQIRKQYVSKSILVCATSNAAVDEIAKRLLPFLSHKDIFRMYAASKHEESIDKEIKPNSNFVDEEVIFLPKEIFIRKKIVITTLTTCIRLVMLNLRSDHFSYIFIDEASQSTELESLIPLTITSSENKIGGMLHAQIVIAGDPHQLGPIVRHREIEHLLGKSLLERLMECGPYKKVNNKYNSRYITKLLRNYRNKWQILYTSNKLFYDNELLYCKDSNKGHITSGCELLSNRTFPIIFFDVKGDEIKAPNMSVYNINEVIFITKLIRILMSSEIDKRKIQHYDVGVVTPFIQQKIMIEKSLYEHNLGKITVGTVDTFQGQEREIIIVSTVRSRVFKRNDKEDIGFLSKPKRFNVAVTRAKNLLIIVGNQSVLCKDKCWETLLKYCEENNACNNEIELDRN
ncbi:putative helicase mov-10-B.1 [Xylocopa sonorina]|uniref:putative helicase mov-10-B.1 n=1 Tax=Xylocopa sonorina TaxID=1818115 RepID=UPI00403ACA14